MLSEILEVKWTQDKIEESNLSVSLPPPNTQFGELFLLQSRDCPSPPPKPASPACSSPSKLPTAEQTPREKSKAHASVSPSSLRNTAISTTVSPPDQKAPRRGKAELSQSTQMGDLRVKGFRCKDPKPWELSLGLALGCLWPTYQRLLCLVGPLTPLS